MPEPRPEKNRESSKDADKDTNRDEFPTVIGSDAVFKGELSFDKGLRVQGQLEGRVSTPGKVHIARDARVQADIEAGSLVVEGDVKGNLNVTGRVELRSTAHYEGDLRAGTLVVEEGAVFSGQITVGPEVVDEATRPPTPRLAGIA